MKFAYGTSDFYKIITQGRFYVDRTDRIPLIEEAGEHLLFLRPRRFGKSLLLSMLENYYDVARADEFDRIFGHLAIGKNPTKRHSQYFVLKWDFSAVSPQGESRDIERNLHRYLNKRIEKFAVYYQDRLPLAIRTEPDDAMASFQSLLTAILNTPHKLCLLIDEYDNFANQLIVAHKDDLYRELTGDDSFLKTFFKTLKEGRKNGIISNVFITGVLPITIDDLASGFNIASFITLEPEFEAMLGFTQAETDHLLDEIYRDYEMDPATRKEVNDLIRNHYNGYHFVSPEGEALYNSTILMYFLHYFTRYKTIPEFLTDMNLRTDLSWVRRITGANPANTEEFVSRLTTENVIAYDKNFLVTKFNMFQFFEKGFYPISFFYLGMLTRQDDFHLRLPNLNMRQIFVEYFNELHRIDVSTKYAEMMQNFVNQPDLPRLFADYWELYVSQLPEAVFQKVNENFYRTTFFELCSRYLSKWFTWNVERSYPRGRTDLEFVGKYHEKFAGTRMVIEFKYYSNAEFGKLHTPIGEFTLREEDTLQIAGYAEGLRQEYPEADISQYVIYCFGNQGFRVFAI